VKGVDGDLGLYWWMKMDQGSSARVLSQVVVRAQRGEEAAITELVAACRGAAIRQAIGILRDRSLAEEAAQEALVLAVDSLSDLQAPEAFVTWLRTIVVRQCDRVTRRRRVHVVPLSDLVEPTDTEPSPDELVIIAEQALTVQAAVGQLPDGQRSAVAAYYLESRTQAETAELLGTSVSTINNRLHAARNTLRRKLSSMNNRQVTTPGPVTTAASSEADPEHIYAALDTTGVAGPHWRQGRLARSRFDWDTSRLAADGTDVAALVGVYDLSMRIGHSTVRTAGFNLDYQADGTTDDTMEQLIAETVSAARQAGYGLGVSVGLSDGLRAAGFVPAWPHLMWFMPTDALPVNGPNHGAELDSTGFEPVHRDDLAALYDREHAGLTGTTLRPTYLVNKEPDGFRGLLWHDDTGAVSGYVSYAVIESWTNRTMLGPSNRGYDRLLWHDESAGDPDTRLAALAELAREHGCHEIALDRLHPRSPLADRIRELPHRVEHGYRHYGINVISLDTTLRSIIDVLDTRLQSSPINGHIEFRLTIDTQSVTIHGRPGDLKVDTPTGREQHAITGDQRLAQLLVGGTPTDRLLNQIDVVGDGRTLAGVLLPTQDPQMDNQSL